MNKVPYANTGKHTVHIGPVMIPPGGSRDVDSRDIPGAGKPTPQATEPPPNEIAQLRKTSVANIESQLPELEAEDLAELLRLEEADKRPRTTLITAIEAERLERAKNALAGDEALDALRQFDVAEIEPQLTELEEDDLANLLQAEQQDDSPRADLVEAIQAEQNARAEKAGGDSAAGAGSEQ